MSEGQRPATLCSDGVIRFEDREHFLDELAGDLGRGRAFVRTSRAIAAGLRLRLELEVPETGTHIPVVAEVVFSRDGHLGLAFERFNDVSKILDDLRRRLPRARGAAVVSFDDQEEAVTGKVEVPPPFAQTSSELTSARRIPIPEGPTLPGEPLPEVLLMEVAPEEDPGQKTERLRAAPPDGEDASEQATRDLRSSTDVRASGPLPDDLTAALSAYLADRPITGDLPDARAEDATSSSPPHPEGSPTATSRSSPNGEDHLLSAPLSPDPPPSVELAGPPAQEPLEAPETARDGAERGVGVVERVSALGLPEPAPLPNPEPEPVEDAPPAEDGGPEIGPSAAEGAELRHEPRNPSIGTLGAVGTVEVVPRTGPGMPEGPARGLRPATGDLVVAPSGEPPSTSPSKPPVPRTDAADAQSEIPAEGLEALQELPLVRASPGGALRVTDPTTLLGLWLSGLRDGVLTVLGGPSAPIGTKTPLKIMSGRVVTVEAIVRARVGPWLTLEIPDRAPIRELLAERVSEWQAALTTLGLGAPGVLVTPANASLPLGGPPGGPAVASAPAPGSGSPAVPLSNPGLAVSPASAFGLAPPSAEPEAVRRLPEPEDPSTPPEPPRLEGDRVCFRHAADLRSALERDLPSGGLFVVAPPLPLRTKQRLRPVVGDVELPIPLEGEVVFAAEGKVGFSLVHASEVCAEMRSVLAEGVRADRAPKPRTPSLRGPTSEGARLHLEGTLGPRPSDEALLDLESTRTGDLELLRQPSSIALFDELVHLRFRGVLRLKSAEGERTIYLHEGNVAFLEALPFDETTALGRILAAHRRISESALRDGLSKAKRSRKSLGRSLVALGLARANDVASALREQTRARIERAFDWTTGGFELTGWREPPGQEDLVVTRGLGVLAHHLRQRFDGLGLPELEGLLGPLLRQPVAPTTSLETAIPALGLHPKELRFLQVSLDGRRSLAEAARLSPVGRLASLRLFAVALALGLVRAMASSSGTPHGRAGTSTGTEARMRRELKNRLELLNSQNHFEVLGVHWSAHHRTFAAAYEAMLAEFSVAKGPYRDAPADVQALARRCSQRVKEAYEILVDDGRRAAYRRELFDPTEREYAAHMLVEKGEVELIRGSKVTAIEHLETAFELAPSDRIRDLLKNAREGRRRS